MYNHQAVFTITYQSHEAMIESSPAVISKKGNTMAWTIILCSTEVTVHLGPSNLRKRKDAPTPNERNVVEECKAADLRGNDRGNLDSMRHSLS